MTRNLTFFLLFIKCTFLFSQQENLDLSEYQDSLKFYFENIINAKNDGERIKANDIFKSALHRAVLADSSFNFGFDSLPKLSKLYSPDKSFKIYNWNIYFENNTYQYFGFIQRFNEKNNTYTASQLFDKSNEIINPEKITLRPKEWYGALYYQVIPVNYKKEKYYILLGWHGNNELTTKKIIDVVEFDSDGFPSFGKPVFFNDREKMKRVIFEFSARATMTLHYDDKLKFIIFDHLMPSKSSYAGQFQYYGPDITQDAYKPKKGRWYYVSDIDVRNPKVKANKNKNNTER